MLLKLVMPTTKTDLSTFRMVGFLLTGVQSVTEALKINRKSIVINVPRTAGRRMLSNRITSGSFFLPAAILLLLYLTVSCDALPTELTNSSQGDKQTSTYPRLSAVTQHKRRRRDTTAESLSIRSQELAPVSLSAVLVPAANPSFEAAFQGECGKNNNSNPCGHICLDLYDGTYECSCFYGFTLAVDGYSCTPVVPSTSKAPPQQLAYTETTSSRQVSRLQSNADTTTSPTATSRIDGTGNVPGPLEAIKSDEHPTNGYEEICKHGECRGSNAGGTPFLIEDENDARKLANDLSRGIKLRETDLDNWISLEAKSTLENGHLSDNLAVLNRKPRLLEAAFKIHNQRNQQNSASATQSKRPSRPTVSDYKSNHHYLAHHLHDSREVTTTTSKLDEATTSSAVESVENATQQKELDSRITGSRLGSASNNNNKEESDIGRLPNRTDSEYNKQSLMESSGKFIELANSNQANADIKSIILANDRLLGELVRSVEAGLSSERQTTSSRVVADDQLYELADGRHDDFWSLKLLDDLIRKSVEEFGTLEAHFRQTTSRLSDSKAQADELPKLVTPAGTGKPAVEAGASSGGPHAAGVYSNCRQLPECQAGGLCTMEQVDSGAPSPEGSRARCRCPLGRGGLLCQRSLQVSVPSFSSHSYLALPLPETQQQTNSRLQHLRLVFRPATFGHADGRASLLLSSPSFTLLLDTLNRVQLSYTSHWGPIRVMGSRDARLDSWNELIVTPDASNDSNMIEHQQHADPPNASHHYDIRDRIVLVTPVEIPLVGEPRYDSSSSSYHSSSRSPELFVGGLPEFAEILQENRGQVGSMEASNRLLSLPAGFRGCIGELSINGRPYNFGSDLRGDSLDGFDINECNFHKHTVPRAMIKQRRDTTEQDEIT